MPAPAFDQASAERLGCVVAGRADRKRKCRLEVEGVQSHLALDIPFAVERHREAPAQARAGDDAVEIVERQPAARQRQVRGQADILRQRIGRFEIEQRRETGAANVQVDAGLLFRRPRFGGALRFRVKSGSGQSGL